MRSPHKYKVFVRCKSDFGYFDKLTGNPDIQSEMGCGGKGVMNR